MAPNTCGGCSKAILGSDFMKCKECKTPYDLLCLGIDLAAFKKYSQDQKDQWLCPSCASSRPKGDNTHTPIRGPTAPPSNTYNASENVNTTRGNRAKPAKTSSAPPSSTNPGMPELVKEIRHLRDEVISLKEQKSEITLLRKEVQEIRTQFSLVTNSLTKSIKEYEEKVRVQQITITELNDALYQLQQSQNALEQSTLLDEFEIAGIEESDNENLHHLALVTATKLGVPLAADEVCRVYRAGPKRASANVVTTSESFKKTPRPIVVKLMRRLKRDELVKAARSRRKLTSEDIVSGPVTKVYINERLTKFNRALFHAARQRSALHHFRYCWTSNGSIYARRAEGTSALHIRSMLEIDLRIGPPAVSIPIDPVQLEDLQCSASPQLPPDQAGPTGSMSSKSASNR